MPTVNYSQIVQEALMGGMTCRGWGWCTVLHRGWFWPRGYTGYYEIYRGIGSPLNIDWSTPIATTTSTTIDVSGPPHIPNGIYYYAIRSVSIYGVSDYNKFRIIEVVFDSEGNPEGLRAAPPVGLRIIQAPGGAFDLRFAYRTAGEYAPATSFNVYEGPIPGLIDYDTSVASLTIRRGQLDLVTRTPTYIHNSVHYFVIRSVTADGVEEQNENYISGIADAEAPDNLSTFNVK